MKSYLVMKSTPILLLLALLAFTSCEKVGIDALEDTADDLEIYAELEEPALIDIMEGIEASGAVQIDMVEEPTEGTIALMQGSLLVYTPREGRGGEIDDRFVMTIKEGDRTRRRAVVVRVRRRGNIPPRTRPRNIAVDDRGGIVAPGQMVRVDVLANDLLPRIANPVDQISVLVAPAQGRASFTSDHILTYQAPTNGSGRVNLVYELTTVNNQYGYAMVTFLIQE